MNILVIDGQGGGIGRQIVQSVRAKMPEASVTAVGTNSIAAAAMLKAGANRAATGKIPSSSAAATLTSLSAPSRL